MTTEGCEQLTHYQMERVWLRSKLGQGKQKGKMEGHSVLGPLNFRVMSTSKFSFSLKQKGFHK